MKSKNIFIVAGFVAAASMPQIAIGDSCYCGDGKVNGYCPTECMSGNTGCETGTCDTDGLTYCTPGGIAPSGCRPSLGCDTQTTAWQDVVGQPYQYRTYVNPIKCTQTTQYRCKAGYYGEAEVTTIPTCTQCPSYGTGYGMTASGGATSATECYISSGISFSDTAGSGKYTSNCYWTN